MQAEGTSDEVGQATEKRAPSQAATTPSQQPSTHADMVKPGLVSEHPAKKDDSKQVAA